MKKNKDDLHPPTDATLMRMGLPAWSWEWLRHNRAYAESPDLGLGKKRVLRTDPLLTVIELKRNPSPDWGLCFAEDPQRPYQRAAVFWRPEIDKTVCPVTAQALRSNRDGAIIDLDRIKVTASVLVMPSGEEHLLVCDGANAIQLHIMEGTLLDGPRRLAHVLNDFGRLPEHFLTLERFGVMLTRKRFPSAMFPPLAHAARWTLMLKAIELEAAGLNQAEIALQLYDNGDEMDSFATDWRRSRVRRLLDKAHAFIEGGYLKTLMRGTKLSWQSGQGYPHRDPTSFTIGQKSIR